MLEEPISEELYNGSYPDAWAYTFAGMIHPADAGRLFHLHQDIRFAYALDDFQKRLVVVP